MLQQSVHKALRGIGCPQQLQPLSCVFEIHTCHGSPSLCASQRLCCFTASRAGVQRVLMQVAAAVVFVLNAVHLPVPPCCCQVTAEVVDYDPEEVDLGEDTEWRFTGGEWEHDPQTEQIAGIGRKRSTP